MVDFGCTKEGKEERGNQREGEVGKRGGRDVEIPTCSINSEVRVSHSCFLGFKIQKEADHVRGGGEGRREGGREGTYP